jgi:hypothetical protein
MTIATNPKRKLDGKATAFVAGAGRPALNDDENMKPIIVRVKPDILARIDRAAKRLSISRSAFIISTAAERVERMEGGER